MFETLTYEELISIAGRRIDKKHSEKVFNDYREACRENMQAHGQLADDAKDSKNRLIDYHFSLIGEATATIKRAKNAIKKSKGIIASLEKAVIEDANKDAFWNTDAFVE